MSYGDAWAYLNTRAREAGDPNTLPFVYAGTLVGPHGEQRHVFTRERREPGAHEAFVVQMLDGDYGDISEDQTPDAIAAAVERVGWQVIS